MVMLVVLSINSHLSPAAETVHAGWRNHICVDERERDIEKEREGEIAQEREKER